MSAIRYNKDVFTTGDVARICSVAPRTVSKWFDAEQLHGYRIPGSKDRRIPRNQLIRFMKKYGMPLNGLSTGCSRLLIVDDDKTGAEVLQKVLEEVGKYEVKIAQSGFAAGLAVCKFHPDVILLNMHLSDIDSREVAGRVKNDADLQLIKIIAMSNKMTEKEVEQLSPALFDAFLRKPCNARQVFEAIEKAISVIY